MPIRKRHPAETGHKQKFKRRITMLNPPKNLVLELPGRTSGCPIACSHCIHKGMEKSLQPNLSPEEIKSIITQGRDLQIEFLNIYLHDDDICLQPYHSHEYIKLGHKLGYKIKALTSGINPEGVERLLPYTYRLSVSVDSLDVEIYSRLRKATAHSGMMQTLQILDSHRKQNSGFQITALVMVNKKTIDSVEKRVEDLCQLNLFTKIKLLEMLPVGDASQLAEDALTSKEHLDRLARIRKKYEGKIEIGTPLWRIKDNMRGCRLGIKDLVIGPQGQLAGCTLLLYINYHVGNIRDVDSLEEAWKIQFDIFREKNKRSIGEVCNSCSFYEKDLCWGGCLARSLIFGRELEISRSCGISNTSQSQELFAMYDSNNQSNLPFPANIIEDN